MADIEHDALSEISELTPKQLLEKDKRGELVVGYNFTPQEQQAIDKLAHQIDLRDQASLITYGADTQSKLSEFSDKKLAQYSTKSLGEAGKELTTLVTSLKTYNPDYEKNLSKNPVVRFFQTKKKDATDAIAEAQATYASLQDNVNTAEKILRKDHLDVLKRDVRDFDDMYELNLQFYRELSMFIAAGKAKLEEAKTVELPEVNAKAEETGSALAYQEAKDLAEAINSFEAKIYSLDLSRQQCIYTAASIRQLQAIYRALADQILQILVTAVPTWRVQMRMHLGIKDAQDAKAAIDMAYNFTQQIILSGAEQLSKLTEETGESVNRPTISLDTTIKVNDIFISTLERQIEINKNNMREIREGEGVLKSIEAKRNAAMISFSQEMTKTSMEHALTGTEETSHLSSTSTPAPKSTSGEKVYKLDL